MRITPVPGTNAVSCSGASFALTLLALKGWSPVEDKGALYRMQTAPVERHPTLGGFPSTALHPKE